MRSEAVTTVVTTTTTCDVCGHTIGRLVDSGEPDGTPEAPNHVRITVANTGVGGGPYRKYLDVCGKCWIYRVRALVVALGPWPDGNP